MPCRVQCDVEAGSAVITVFGNERLVREMERCLRSDGDILEPFLDAFVRSIADLRLRLEASGSGRLLEIEGVMRSLLDAAERRQSEALGRVVDRIAADEERLSERVLAVTDSVRSSVESAVAAWTDRLRDAWSGIPEATARCLRGVEEDSKGRLHDRVSEVRVRIDEARAEAQRHADACRAELASLSRALPLAVRSTLQDALTQQEVSGARVLSGLDDTRGSLQRVERALSVVQTETNSACGRMDTLLQQVTASATRQAICTRSKGQQGEGILLELLQQRLSSKDDYRIEMVRGLAHNCDISVRRLGFPDVRIESKAHGQQSGEKVRSKEVERFREDLVSLNAHGIFVSLYSGIVGKGAIELEMLASGKLAVYLSNNGYDIDLIHDVLRLIYRIDRMGSPSDAGCRDDTTSRVVSNEALRRVQLYLKDFGVKVARVRTHLKDSISILSDMAFDAVERLLCGDDAITPGGIEPTAATTACVRQGQGQGQGQGQSSDGGSVTGNHAVHGPHVPGPGPVHVHVPVFTCNRCEKTFKSRAGLASHYASHLRSENDNRARISENRSRESVF
jgi:hypothetical protein